MSLRSFLDLGGAMTVETFVEKWGSRVYIGYTGGVSAFFDSPKNLRKFLRLPIKSPSRERLDEWLAGLEQPAATEESSSAELAATGFGPEHHGDALDPSDPNHATRMVT
jgi:hypothetical protein